MIKQEEVTAAVGGSTLLAIKISTTKRLRAKHVKFA